MTDRPNVLLIMTDQQRADSLGYAGADPIATPNLDSLAHQGVIFDAAYSSSTSCAPARGSLLTGLLPHRYPRLADDITLREGYWTIAHAMRRAGYETALFGKMHFKPMYADHGFEKVALCEHLKAGYAEDAADDYRLWLESTGRHDRRFKKPAQPRTFRYPAEYHATSWITRQGIDFLENRDDSRPFFAVISYAHPHTPYDPPEPYASMFSPDEITVPRPGIEINADLPKPFLDAIFDTSEDGYMVPLRTEQRPIKHVRRVLAAIRALVKQIDDGVGEIMRHVDMSNTAVFFTSDHGDYGGHRGFLGKIPWIPFDDLARVPLFATGLDFDSGRRVSEPVQSFDYVPTALALAGVPMPCASMSARNQLPVLRGAPADGDRAVFCGPTQGWPTVRRGSLKHIWHSYTDTHAVYDLATDPAESHNLAADPAYRKAIDDGVAMLTEELSKPIPDLWQS